MQAVAVRWRKTIPKPSPHGAGTMNTNCNDLILAIDLGKYKSVAGCIPVSVARIA
jgi:hypothetical protein